MTRAATPPCQRGARTGAPAPVGPVRPDLAGSRALDGRVRTRLAATGESTDPASFLPMLRLRGGAST